MNVADSQLWEAWVNRLNRARPTTEQAEWAVMTLLAYVGEDPHREGLSDTPGRVVAALVEMTGGYREEPETYLTRTFAERSDELVLVRGVDFVSLCEHHVLPFTGVAHVGYLPGDRVIGLSKLARVVDVYARRLQVQERLTQQIADAIMDHGGARGAGVIVEATHACMSCRGARKPGARMVTSAMLGTLREDKAQRMELLALVG